MKVEKLKQEKLSYEYKVTVPSETINSAFDKKLKKIATQAKFPGFRPGKAPIDVVKSKYGEDALNEVVRDVLTASIGDAISGENIKPATQPRVEEVDFKEGSDLVYKLSIDVIPQFPETDFSKIKLLKTVAEVAESDVDALIEGISKNQKVFAKAEFDKEAELGDALIIDFHGFINGVAFEGGQASGYQLELGSKSFIDTFEEQLVGAKAGDSRTVNVTFPANYGNQELAGKAAEFKVDVTEVRVAGATELNDDFAKNLGFESLDKLREVVRQQIEGDAENIARVLIKKQLFDALEKEVKVDLPEKLVEAEFAGISAQIKSSATEEEKADLTPEKFESEYRPLARRRVLLGLLVSDIADKNKIVVNPEEVNRALQQELMRFPGQEKQVVEYYKKNPQAVEALRGPILEEKVVDFILEKISTKENKVSFEELRTMILQNNSN